ncbi:MAG: polysaccharide biosynthesis tyrosine autokinase [Bacteroidales bacterium]|nr:polysaccharide biosynthesis tyrosine autokinase [Bacteroidales bacterium]
MSQNQDIHSLLESTETFDVKKFIFKILSNWYWFVLTIFIAISFTYFVNKYTDPIYSVKASILIRDKSNSANSGIENIVQEFRVFDRVRRKNVENEIGVLYSYSLIRKVVEKLNFNVSYFSVGRIRQPEMYNRAPFTVVVDTLKKNKFDTPIHLILLNNEKYSLILDDEAQTEKELYFGMPYSSGNYNFTIFKKDFDLDSLKGNEYYFVINNLNGTTNGVKRKLKIESSDDKSSILVLSSTGKVIAKEVDFLNMLCDQYIQMDLDEKNEINAKTIKFIDEQLGSITDSLRLVEDKLQQFKENNRIVNLSNEGKELFTQLEKIQAEKAELIVKDQYFNYLLEYIKSNKDTLSVLSPSFAGINDGALNRLVLDLNDLYSQRSALSYGASKNNPVIALYNGKITQNKQLISENVKTIINSNNLSIEGINKRIDRLDNDIRKLPVTEKQLINIQRKYALNDEIYNYLLQKRAETGIVMASNTAENKILDYSRTDNAIKLSPNEKTNYIIAIIIAFFIPLLIIVLIDFFDNKIHERKDIEKRTNIPIIAEIGHNNKNSDLVVHAFPRSSISESFRKLRTNLKYSLINKTEGSTVLSVTSTISGEGKTFTAVNTASVLAALDKKTIIIGLDLRKPSLHKYFEFENEDGVSEYLTNSCDLQQIIRPTKVKNLSVILAGAIPPNPAELLELAKMNELIEHLKESFDYVILDTPPIALVTDALLLSPSVDIHLYVIRQDYSNISVLEFLNDIKEKNKINLNIVINDINLSGYYSYKYNYNYKYGGTYYSHNYYDEEIKLPFAIKLLKKLKRS